MGKTNWLAWEEISMLSLTELSHLETNSSKGLKTQSTSSQEFMHHTHYIFTIACKKGVTLQICILSSNTYASSCSMSQFNITYFVLVRTITGWVWCPIQSPSFCIATCHFQQDSVLPECSPEKQTASKHQEQLAYQALSLANNTVNY